jgi:hypothetical protein
MSVSYDRKTGANKKNLSHSHMANKRGDFSLSERFGLVAAANLAGTEAPRANVHLGRFTVDDDVHTLDVRRPATLGLAVGMADQIAGHDTLVADFTVLTHANSPPP